MRNTKTTVTFLSAAACAALLLTGCSAIEDVLQKEKSSTYDDRDAFTADSGLEARWLPEDSTAIDVVRSTQAADAAIAVESSTLLAPDLCAEIDRRSAPAYQPGPEVDVYKISEAFACGDWTVVQTDDGWLGWTPGDPDEKAQSPIP
jgi:hypothetical protein